MPSQKTRSKEDTWTTDELSRALNQTSERKQHRDRDADRKRDRVNGEDKELRHRGEDSERRHRRAREEDENGRAARLTEDERERQREERRRRREGKVGGSSKDKKGELQFRGKPDNKGIELNDVYENDSDDRQKRHRGDIDGDRRQLEDDDRERRHHDRERRHRNDDMDSERRPHHKDADDDRDKRRRHREDADNDVERQRKHGDSDDRDRRKREDDGKELERRRTKRRRGKETNEEEERRIRHEEKKEIRKEEERRKDRGDRDNRSDRHNDRSDRDRHRESEQEREERKEREREERRKEKEERHKEKGSEKSSRHKEEEKKEEEEEEYNYEEDFEDYEEDFEEEEEEADDDMAVTKPRNVQDSEVNEVLRALDAENERLLNSSSRSPQVSAGNSNWGERGDSDSDDGYQKSYQPRADRPRTAINFVSAKQRVVSRKTASKTMQRGNDLLKMLELDYASFDIMDLPPVNEYDLYIRAFGSSNTRQAYVQTNDDNVERDIQTEETDTRNKWTQHPPEDYKGCGRGDGEKDIDDEEESQNKHSREQDLGRLSKFLEKAGQVIAILLEEGKEEEAGSKGQSQTHINVSDGYTQIDLLPIFQDRHVIFSHFSPVQPNLLLTLYSSPSQVSEENPVSKRGVICVWNTNEPNYPQKILVCNSEPRCCCFSPVRPSLVFAGMVDGSIAMWDLREPTSIHRSTVVSDEAYSLRYPTYDTACVLKEENHHSPVSSIVPIYSYIDVSKSDTSQSQAVEDASSGLSFQLVSTEESAVLHFWVVAEIGTPNIAGSEDDLGLAPGAGVKLLKSSTLAMSNQSKDTRWQSGLRALDMTLMPNDPNHFYIATDSGCVLHGIRFGKRIFPRAHMPVIESIVDVVSIDFSPFDQPCFLSGCSDGTFSLYDTKSENPLMTWPSVTRGQAVQCVRWSRSRPCVFYVLDVTSTLYVFDLLEGDGQPKHIDTISKERITSFSLTTVQRPDGLGPSGKHAQMLFSFEGGMTEIHTITKSLSEPEQLEADYLASYLQRF